MPRKSLSELVCTSDATVILGSTSLRSGMAASGCVERLLLMKLMKKPLRQSARWQRFIGGALDNLLCLKLMFRNICKRNWLAVRNYWNILISKPPF